MSNATLLPCATCPWRLGKDASTIPRYVHEKACGLMDTVGKEDGFRKIMACHHSNGSEPAASMICKGYLAQAGWSNLNVRLLLAQGLIPSPDAVRDACEAEGVELEPDYPTTLEKLSNSVLLVDYDMIDMYSRIPGTSDYGLRTSHKCVTAN